MNWTWANVIRATFEWEISTVGCFMFRRGFWLSEGFTIMRKRQVVLFSSEPAFVISSMTLSASFSSFPGMYRTLRWKCRKNQELFILGNPPPPPHSWMHAHANTACAWTNYRFLFITVLMRSIDLTLILHSPRKDRTGANKNWTCQYKCVKLSIIGGYIPPGRARWFFSHDSLFSR